MNNPHEELLDKLKTILENNGYTVNKSVPPSSPPQPVQPENQDYGSSGRMWDHDYDPDRGWYPDR